MSIVPALKGFFGKFVFLHFCMPPRTKMHESCTIGLPRSEVVLIATWLLLDMHIVPSRTSSIHRSFNQSLISSIPLSIPPSIRGRCPEEKPFSLLFCYLGGLHTPSINQSIIPSIPHFLPPSLIPSIKDRCPEEMQFILLLCYVWDLHTSPFLTQSIHQSIPQSIPHFPPPSLNPSGIVVQKRSCSYCYLAT